MRTEHTVGYIYRYSLAARLVSANILKRQLLLECPSLKPEAVWNFGVVQESLSLSASREISLCGPPIIHTKVYEALWKHPLPDVWIALIEDGSSTGQTCNRFNCINRWESDGWVDECPDISFFSLCKAARRVFMQSRAFSIFELIDIKRDSIYIGLNFPEKYR